LDKAEATEGNRSGADRRGITKKGTEWTVSLDPARLPEYAVRAVLRMNWAMAASLVFTQ